MVRRVVWSWLQAYVRLSMRHAGWLLVALLLLTVAAGSLGQRLRINPKLDALLPADTVSARSIEELGQRVRSGSPLYLLVQSPDLELSRSYARRLETRVRQWPEADWVMSRRDPTYFMDRRLLLVPAPDLQDFADQLDERMRWEECAAIPGCVNMDRTAPDLPNDADLQQLFEKNPQLSTLASVFGAAPGALFKNDDVAAPPSAPNAGAQVEPGELCDPIEKVCAVQASLKGDPSSLEFAGEILERSEKLFAELKAEAPGAELKFAVSGQYRNGPKTRQVVIEDLAKTTLISTFLVFLVVFSQFRGLRSLLVLFVPIFSSIAWTSGALAAVHPSLNLISAFTMAILTGMGIDFGLHLLTHYTRGREQGATPESAMLHTWQSIGPSLTVAALTTAFGFGALAVASFRGFSEMGPIAAFGVMVALGGFFVLMPPLVALFDRGDRCPFALRKYNFNPWGWLRRRARWVVAFGCTLAVGLGAVALGVGGKGVEFEYDFRKLDPENMGHGIPWGRTLHGTNRTAVYLMADDANALHDAAEALRKEPPQDLTQGNPLSLVIPSAFIPTEQEKKLETLKELGETLHKAKEYTNPELTRSIERLEPLTKVREPITPEQMPRWVSDWLFERDGRFGTLGVMYTDLRGSDARQMEVLVKNLEDFRQRFPNVRFASTVAQLGEVTPRLRKEAPWIIGLAVLGAGLGTVLLGRNWWRIVAVFLPMLLMTGVSLGLAGLFGLKVNLYNMLVFPLAFGIGIDGAVYIDWAFENSKSSELLPTAARAVLGATLTSIAAFGALVWSNNPGLGSIGSLAMLMLGTALIANLVWLPSLYWITHKRNS
jgi:uncharacterized protein